MKTLIYSTVKIVPKAATECLFRHSFAIIGQRFPVYNVLCTTCLSRLLEQFSESQAAVEKAHRRLPESRKKLPEEFSFLLGGFLENVRDFRR